MDERISRDQASRLRCAGRRPTLTPDLGNSRPTGLFPLLKEDHEPRP
jgi:hypothetical protein